MVKVIKEFNECVLLKTGFCTHRLSRIKLVLDWVSGSNHLKHWLTECASKLALFIKVEKLFIKIA